jgi:hypothetical protein
MARPSVAAVLIALVAALLLSLAAAPAAWAARDTDSYDGNIYALYAGNGSLVPPATDLADSRARGRVSLLSFYLDDSAASKAFAPVLSEIQRLWGRSIDLIILPSDPLQGRASDDPGDPAHYWSGLIPQVVVLDGEGRVVMDESGPVAIETINSALAGALGRAPAEAVMAPQATRSFNELNSEVVPRP